MTWSSRDARNAYQREWRRRNPNYHARSLVNNARARSKRLGLPFDITFEDIAVPEVCPILGIPIAHSRTGKRGTYSDHSPSIDRIVPALGYVRGNVVVISLRANRIKNDASLQELDAVTTFYRNLKP